MSEITNEKAVSAAKPPLHKRVLNIIFDVVIALIFILGIFVSVVSLTARANGGIPSLFGHSILVVETESMTGTIDQGDIILVDQFSSDKAEKQAQLETLVPNKSIVTFYADLNKDGIGELVTHQYLGKYETASYTYYQFQGTYNPNDEVLGIQQVTADNVVGLYTGTRVSKIGFALDFLRSPLGFGLIIVLPVFIFFVYSLIKLIMAIMERHKPQPIVPSISPEDKEKIRQEILKEMEDEKQLGDSAEENTKNE